MTPFTGWPEPAVGHSPGHPAGLPGGFPARSDHEVVELMLLLPRSQATALEAAARARGMTTGQILRRVIADLFPAAEPALAGDR